MSHHEAVRNGIGGFSDRICLLSRPKSSKTRWAIPEGVPRHAKTGTCWDLKGPLGKTFKSFSQNSSRHRGLRPRRSFSRPPGFRKRGLFHTATRQDQSSENICEGLVTGYTVRMKVVFAHFSGKPYGWDGKQIIIENFQGERAPRVHAHSRGHKGRSQGGRCCAYRLRLDRCDADCCKTSKLKTKVKNKDHRVFLDGIYVYEKKKGLD